MDEGLDKATGIGYKGITRRGAGAESRKSLDKVKRKQTKSSMKFPLDTAPRLG